LEQVVVRIKLENINGKERIGKLQRFLLMPCVLGT